MASFVQDALTSTKAPNLSFYSLPAALFLAAVPHWWSIHHALHKKINGGWQNQNPRSYVAQLNFKAASGKKLSPIEKQILRAQSGEFVFSARHARKVRSGSQHRALFSCLVDF